MVDLKCSCDWCHVDAIIQLQIRVGIHIHINYCRLLCHLLVILKVIFANSVAPDQTAPLEP